MLRKFLLFLFIFEILFTSTSLGTTSSNGLTDDMQFKLVKGLFDSKLYYSAEVEAKTYISQFPNGNFLEIVLFLKARSSEQLAQQQKNKEIQLKKLEEVIRQYHNYRIKYPKGQWIEETTFSEGYLNIHLHHYEEAIEILESFIETYPKNKNKDQALYWIGRAAFNRADQVQKNQSPIDLQPLYQKATTALTNITNIQNLSKEHQTNRMFLLGWSYQYQQKPDKAKKYFSEYTRRTEDSSNTVRISYQLAQNAWEAKRYNEAIRYFDKVLKFPDSPLSVNALFSKAEIKYLLFRENFPGPRLHPKGDHVISLYLEYLNSKNSKYDDIAKSRITDILFQQGQNAWQKKRYQNALKHFEQLKKYPNSKLLPPSLFALAEIQYTLLKKSKGQPTTSQPKKVNSVIKLYHDYLATEDTSQRAITYYRLGTLYSSIGNDQKTIENFKQLKKYPHSELLPPSLFTIAELEYTNFLKKFEGQPSALKPEKVNSIIQLYKDYLKTNDVSQKGITHYRLATLYSRINKNQKAVEHFQFYLKTNEQSLRAITYFQLGNHYTSLGNKEAAIENYQLYLKTNDTSQSANTHYLLARLYLEKEQYQKAIKQFQQLNQYPDSVLYPLSLFAIAEIEHTLYLKKSAEPPKEESSPSDNLTINSIISLYNDYLKTNDSSKQAITYYRLGTLYSRLENNQKAIDHFQLYLKAVGPPEKGRPSDDRSQQAITYFQLGDHYSVIGDSKNAVKYYQLYLKSDDQSQRAITYYRLGSIFSSQNDHQKAIQYFQLYLKAEGRSEESHPTAQRAITHFRLGRLYFALNQPNQSIDHYEKYLKSNDPTYTATVHFELGKLYELQGNYQQAIASLKQAKQSKQYQNNTELFQLIIQLLEKTGQHQEKQRLLGEASDNQTLSDQERLFFLIKAISSFLENDQCKEILEELSELPKTNNSEEKNFFLYSRGQCLIQANQWEKATVDLELIKDDSTYKKSVFPLLIFAYQQLESWNELATHLEYFLSDNSSQRDQAVSSAEDHPIEFLSSHFEILLNAYQQLENWEKVRSTYVRWDNKYPKEVQKPTILINWAQTEEKLQNREASKKLYEKALTLIPTETSEGHLAEGKGVSADLIELREQVLNYLINLYIQDNDYGNVTRLYEERVIPHLTQPIERQKHALLLGKMYYSSLKNYKKARQWLRQADLGQTTDIDLEAGMVLSAVEIDDKQLEPAIAILLQLISRKLQNTPWKIKVYHRLAALYERKSQWQQALNHHKIVALYSRINNEEDQELQQNSKQRIEEIESFLANKKLEELIDQKLWKQVAQFIKEAINNHRLALSNALYETLIFAETEEQNWKGILEAYNQWEKFDSTKVITYETFLARGQAAENLLMKDLAKKYYITALSLVSSQDLNTRIFLTERLGLIYAQQNNYEQVVQVYQKTYPYLKKKTDQIHFAYIIANYYLDPLNQKTQARVWFKKADQGGVSEEELSAIWNLAEIDKEKSPKLTIKLLAQAASRPLSTKPQWYILINYSLGLLYHSGENWRKAIIHYNRVAKAPPLNEYKELQQKAKIESKAITEYLKSKRKK